MERETPALCNIERQGVHEFHGAPESPDSPLPSHYTLNIPLFIHTIPCLSAQRQVPHILAHTPATPPPLPHPPGLPPSNTNASLLVPHPSSLIQISITKFNHGWQRQQFQDFYPNLFCAAKMVFEQDCS